MGGFSLGRFLGSFFLGWLFNKRGAKISLLFSLVITLLGNILYSLNINKWTILGARFITGFGTGVLSVVRAGIAENTSKQDRAKYMAYSGATQFFAFSILPGATAALSHVHFSLGWLEINQYTSGGYLLVLLDIVACIVVAVSLHFQANEKGRNTHF